MHHCSKRTVLRWAEKTVQSHPKDRDSQLASTGSAKDNAAADDKNSKQLMNNEEHQSDTSDAVLVVPKTTWWGLLSQRKKQKRREERELKCSGSAGFCSLQPSRWFKVIYKFGESVVPTFESRYKKAYLKAIVVEGVTGRSCRSATSPIASGIFNKYSVFLRFLGVRWIWKGTAPSWFGKW